VTQGQLDAAHDLRLEIRVCNRGIGGSQIGKTDIYIIIGRRAKALGVLGDEREAVAHMQNAGELG
jgi:hypothetical protein